MKSIVSFIILFAIGPALHSQVYDSQALRLPEPTTIEGEILRDKLGIQLTLPDHSKYFIRSSKRSTLDDLALLESGDHLVGQGHVFEKEKTVWLEDIEMVGIRRVLGTWQESQKKKNYFFKDFSTLSVSTISFKNEVLNYRLVPDKKDQWTIFLSGDAIVRVGSLKYRPDSMQIEIVDLTSGRITETLTFRRRVKLP